jgi:hypothetical protein
VNVRQDAAVGSAAGQQPGRGLPVAGGLCAILWPLLTIAYYAAYPLAAGGAMLPQAGGLPDFAARLAELGRRPAIVTLDWSYAALPLLLWPFFIALYRLLSRRGQRDLGLVATGLGFLAMGLMVLSATFTPTLLYALGQAAVGAGSEAGGAAILSVLHSLTSWVRGLNQASSLLYQACVGFLSLALILSRTWRIRGWIGLLGAILAVPAKVSLGIDVPSNVLWTGLAYIVWPVAVGWGLLKLQGNAYE